ncbi:hypothetical protein BK860_24170 [Salmonella enterica subsp. enterica serovar Typhimurium]|nr:hypothetical protein [Salmonella enterica subsp. enterica serovar Typhimurium]
MQQRDVFSDQASIASWALFSLHRRKLYEYRNANGVKISVKMRSPEHYARCWSGTDRVPGKRRRNQQQPVQLPHRYGS